MWCKSEAMAGRSNFSHIFPVPSGCGAFTGGAAAWKPIKMHNAMLSGNILTFADVLPSLHTVEPIIAVCLDALDKLCAVTSLQYRLCDVPQLPTAQSQQDSRTSNSNPSSQYFLQYIGLLFPLVKLEKTCHERSYAAWGGTGLGCSLSKLGSSSASYLSTAEYRHKERTVWRETCKPQRSED